METLVRANAKVSFTTQEERIRKAAVSERESRWKSDPERDESEVREEVSRAMAKVHRYDDGKKVWYIHRELVAKLKETRRFRYDDKGVLQNMIREVVLAWAGLREERSLYLSGPSG